MLQGHFKRQIREPVGHVRRITCIHQHFKLPEESGGTRSYEFAKRLATDGHRVTVVCAGNTSKKYRRDGFWVIQHRVPYDNAMSKAARLRSFVRFLLSATKTVVSTPTDVVFATSTPLTAAIPGIVGAACRRARFVFEVRDLWPSVPARLGYLTNRVELRLAQMLERAAYDRADRIIALSPSMRDGVLQTAPFAEVTVVPNASDFGLFSMSDEEREGARSELGWTLPTIVYAGSFGHTYRIPWLVELAAAYPEGTIQIIGKGAASEIARTTCLASGLNPEQVLPGSLPKLEVARRIAAADAVFSSLDNDPALAGNSLNKVFDALAAGRPVLFNHDGWLSELLCSNGAGWRLCDDPFLAARQCAVLLTDKPAIEAAGVAAGALGRRLFDRDKLYQTFRDALLGVGSS